jgi:protoporphyrinogen oxidase
MGVKSPIAIVGGGLAGLTAGSAMRQAGVPFRLFEAGTTLGGLATSERDRDGFAYDFGAHFITNRLAKAIGSSDECYDVRRYGESVVVDGRSASYPFGLLRDPRYLASAAVRRIRDAKAKRTATTAAEWFESQYGEKLANEIALPLLEAWSGLPATQLSAAVGQQMPSSIVRTAWLKAAAIVTQRAVASGYCSSKPESASVWHVYPHRGLATLCERIGESFSESIEYGARASKIYIEDERVVGLRINDRDIDASAVLCSAPINIVAGMIEGSTAFEPFARFRYRPMIFVNVRLKGRGLLSDIVVWTPGGEFPFFRLTEAPAAMGTLAPVGMTTITCDIGAQIGDTHWTMSDDALGDLCVSHLESLVPDIRSRYLGCRVMRTPIAYPVFALEYEDDRRKLPAAGGIAGLHLIGRNGEFRHDLMEDVYWRTLARAERIVAEFTADSRAFSQPIATSR